MKNWHQTHRESQSVGDRIADSVSSIMGSWAFIIWLTVLIIAWVSLNVFGWFSHWDVYPFVLLNLFFSAQATYSAPLILMAGNRAADRDRHQAEADYQTNRDAKEEIEALQMAVANIEETHLIEIGKKLDKILKKK